MGFELDQDDDKRNRLKMIVKDDEDENKRSNI